MLREKFRREYEIWKAMRQRCLNKKNKAYKNYGGRGIKISKEWNSFETFLKDMGRKPDKKSLDRINNESNYSKENCRWATRKLQSRNKRNNRILELNGEKKILQDWANEFKISSLLVFKRLKRGWSLQKALTEKSKFGKQNKSVIMKKEGKVIKIWNSMSEAGRNGFNAAHICQCCTGKRPTHQGFEWQYA